MSGPNEFNCPPPDGACFDSVTISAAGSADVKAVLRAVADDGDASEVAPMRLVAFRIVPDRAHSDRREAQLFFLRCP